MSSPGSRWTDAGVAGHSSPGSRAWHQVQKPMVHPDLAARVADQGSARCAGRYSQPWPGCFPGRCGRAGWLRRISDGGAVARAPAVLSKPLMKRIPADAPGRNAPCSFLADEPAGGAVPAVHRAVVPHVLWPGLRVPHADGEADGVRDADRGGPGAGVAARPGALVLLSRPLEPR